MSAGVVRSFPEQARREHVARAKTAGLARNIGISSQKSLVLKPFSTYRTSVKRVLILAYRQPSQPPARIRVVVKVGARFASVLRLRAAEHSLHLLYRTLMHVRQNVRVGVQGQGDGSVAQPLGHNLGILALGQSMGARSARHHDSPILGEWTRRTGT